MPRNVNYMRLPLWCPVEVQSYPAILSSLLHYPNSHGVLNLPRETLIAAIQNLDNRPSRDLPMMCAERTSTSPLFPWLVCEWFRTNLTTAFTCEGQYKRETEFVHLWHPKILPDFRQSLPFVNRIIPIASRQSRGYLGQVNSGKARKNFYIERAAYEMK